MPSPRGPKRVKYGRRGASLSKLPFRPEPIGRFRLFLWIRGGGWRCASCLGRVRHDPKTVARHAEREIERWGGLLGLERRLESIARFRRGRRHLREKRYQFARKLRLDMDIPGPVREGRVRIP